jgi:hypothetical protein
MPKAITPEKPLLYRWALPTVNHVSARAPNHVSDSVELVPVVRWPIADVPDLAALLGRCSPPYMQSRPPTPRGANSITMLVKLNIVSARLHSEPRVVDAVVHSASLERCQKQDTEHHDLQHLIFSNRLRDVFRKDLQYSVGGILDSQELLPSRARTARNTSSFGTDAAATSEDGRRAADSLRASFSYDTKLWIKVVFKPAC